jgi:hypothetical protein
VGEAIVCLNIGDDAVSSPGDGEGVAVEHPCWSLMIRLTNTSPENGRRRAR